MIVAEPTALIALETRKFLIRPNPSDEPTFAKAEWSDNAPKLLQTKIIQTFENAGLSKTVSRPAEGLVADKQLALDIRKFQISTSPEPMAEIEFAAKIMSDNGRIVEAKVFQATCAGQSTECRFGCRGARRSLWQVCHRVGDMGCRRHVIWASLSVRIIAQNCTRTRRNSSAIQRRRNGGAFESGLVPLRPIAWHMAQCRLTKSSPRFSGDRCACVEVVHMARIASATPN